MARISDDNPHGKDLDRLQAEYAETYRMQKQLRKDIKLAEKAAESWERKNSPIKSIGKELLAKWESDEAWREALIDIPALGSIYREDVREGWVLSVWVTADKSKYTQNVWAHGHARLHGPDGSIRKTTDMELGEYTDHRVSMQKFMPYIGSWLTRMSKRG